MKRRKQPKDFLNDFLGKTPSNIEDLKKNTIRHDKWDRESYDHLMDEMRELAAAEDKLSDVVETGGSAFSDAFFSLVKADPKQENPNEVRPSHQVNHAVLGELMDLKEWEEMRSYCLSPEARVLTADLRWIPADDLIEGMQLMAFDEFPVVPEGGTASYARRWRTSVVEKVQVLELPCYDLTFDDGTTVRCSEDHMWLGYEGTTLVWRKTKDLRPHVDNSVTPRPDGIQGGWVGVTPGSLVARVLPVWEELNSRDAGYLAAAFDGEGCLVQSENVNPRAKGVGSGVNVATDLSFAQKTNSMFKEVLRLLNDNGFDYCLHFNEQSEINHVYLTASPNGDKRSAKRASVLRFLGSVRPVRLLDKFDPERFGTMNVIARQRVVAMQYVGVQKVIGTGTSTGTLLVEGLASHNSTGDEIAAGLATIAMEPELETLFDKLEQQQKLADQMQQQMQQMQQFNEEMKSVDELMDQLENGDLDDPNGEQGQNFQDQKAKIQAAMDALQQEMQDTQQQFDQAMQQAGPTIKNAMRQAMKDALQGAADMEQAARTWGLDPGTLHRMSPEERIALARRLNNDRFKKIANLFGPMRNMAFAEQQRKTIHSNDEIYDLETGNDLSRILSAELLNIRHPILKKDFYRRFYEGDLLQYKLRGTEKLAKGGIICCIDGSGSMAGEPEMYSKAFGLTLLQIAKAQKREFYAIEFGGPRTMLEYDFRDPKNIIPENVIKFAEAFLNGGTDFMTPLSRSLDLLREEHSRRGAVKADIVFVTDGYCGVDDNWLKQFKEEQERLSFRVYGVAIGCPIDSEPLHTICDGRVLSLQSFVNGDDLRTIFRGL